MAFYYAYLLFYTSWLFILAVPGFILFIYQIYLIIIQYRNGEKIDTDTPFNCIYSLVMALWSTLFVEVWKRRECEIAHIWGVSSINDKNHKDKEERT